MRTNRADGWYQRGDGDWNKVEVPEERAAQIDQARGQVAERKGSIEALDASSFSERRQAASDAWSGRTYDSSRNRSSFDSNRRAELNRSMNARSSGYDRYNSRSAAGGINRSPGTRQIQRRRR